MFLKLFSKPTPPSDLELVQKYQQTGDMRAMGELFERYTEMVYLVCLKYLKDEDDSKDATMQVFEKLIELLKKHQITNFKSWLHVTTRNHCLVLLRSHNTKQVPVDDKTALLMESTALLHLVEEDQQEATLQLLEKGLTELPPEQKTCLELFYLQHKSYKEIALITGCELPKVKSYIQNGRRNLKIYLENHHEQP
ncbi:RNA polymerase sigma factor [Pontibacter qinzhouensis]|uniref:RNA polymerase sigma factor n=1 Tax=Pontibacter qinzhouensis TaxID=2603253 RepID=A0A5C8K7T2_9BACT|nr:RNA polymerase sigma factor [Pontibacter qinzhouensis]TXK48901.1 RNA polymerase sigma factor [Pontibacter qinzhouensis]